MEANKVNIFLSDEAVAFVRSLTEKAQKKVTYNIRRVEGGEMDKERRALIIATHGFVKKTWKVPQNEIARAEAFMKQYYSKE